MMPDLPPLKRHKDGFRIERRTRHDLAIGAVTNPYPVRVDLGFKSDLAAMAAPIDIHSINPLV
ncbi:MAG: hypothetical protein HQ503_11015 [Rhodospirillales bacterium]|nr:hypothetical protein [Rhodospirillales bacterium]